MLLGIAKFYLSSSNSCILTFNTGAPPMNSAMFMWPLSSATSWGVFCRMETKKHPVNIADEKRFILTDFWVSVTLFSSLFCLQSFSMQFEKELGLAFLTKWWFELLNSNDMALACNRKISGGCATTSSIV